MANPSGFALLALPCAAPPEPELDPDPDPFEDCADPFFDDTPKAAAPNVKIAQKTTIGLRTGPKNLSSVRISYLHFSFGGDPIFGWSLNDVMLVSMPLSEDSADRTR
jgi:hypothetical protein